MQHIKEQLYQHCANYINRQRKEINDTISSLQDAITEDTKSSAGDKYETGREMLQQDIDLNTTRLRELDNMQATLDRILPAFTAAAIVPGALVCTDAGNYYLSVSAGKCKIGNDIYYTISTHSPAGAALRNHATGDEVLLNGRTIKIKSIY